MRRSDLEHLIRAAGGILAESEIIIIGSQAILASFPESQLPPTAMRSREADLLPMNDPDEAKALLLSGTIGEGSMFEDTFGVYGDGVGDRTARLPTGWRDRLVPLVNDNTNGVTGWCLEAHDLWVSKALAGRDKDLGYCRALLASTLLDRRVLLERLTSVEATDQERAWVTDLIRTKGRQSAPLGTREDLSGQRARTGNSNGVPSQQHPPSDVPSPSQPDYGQGQSL